MIYANIIVSNKTDLHLCLLPELHRVKKDRSSFSLENKKDKLEINIKAKDAIALRAIMNSITKLLAVYEALEKL